MRAEHAVTPPLPDVSVRQSAARRSLDRCTANTTTRPFTLPPAPWPNTPWSDEETFVRVVVQADEQGRDAVQAVCAALGYAPALVRGKLVELSQCAVVPTGGGQVDGD